MKLSIDTLAKTIQLLEPVTFQSLEIELDSLFLGCQWKNFMISGPVNYATAPTAQPYAASSNYPYWSVSSSTFDVSKQPANHLTSHHSIVE